MTDLVVEATETLGPLSVQLLAAGGHPVGGRHMLSSSMQAATFSDVEPGDYVLVATRPTGEALTRPVRIAGERTRLALTFPTGQRSQHEFLTEAAWRGLVPTVPGNTTFGLPLPAGALPATGSAGLALNAILSSKRRFRSASVSADKALTLYIWPGSETSPLLFPPRISADYLQLSFSPARAWGVRAVGLLNAEGTGPIVMIPPFVDGLELFFIARGAATDSGAQRVSNPSAARVPVAIAKPCDAKLADLLSALGAAILPGAADLWVKGDDPSQSARALDYLLNKAEDPIAATIAGLFLARFQPKLVPLEWVRRLAEITAPFMADGTVLLARYLLRYGEANSAAMHEIKILLDRAGRTSCVFSSTRAQLVQARRLHGFSHSSPSEAGERRPSPGSYLDVSADAGGLEAFWGGGPESPGRTAKKGRPKGTLKLLLRNGTFVPAEPQVGTRQ